MKIFIKLTKIVLNTIATLIIVLGIVFVGLFAYGIQPYVVETGSMEPTIHTGSVCFVNRRAQYDDVQVGDIIAFKLESGAFVTHRVKSISDTGIETKGDANNAADNVITTRDNFIGKNMYSVPGAGFIVKGLQTARGKIILGTIIVVLLAAAILVGKPSKRKENKNNKDNKDNEEK